MILTEANAPPYTDRVKVPKYTGTLARVEAPSAIFRRAFPGWTAADHAREAKKFAERTGYYGREYSRLLEHAIKQYGERGPAISGIYQAHFPERVKEHLRETIQAYNAYGAAAQAHYYATGKRVPFHQTALYKEVVGRAGGYGIAGRR